MFDVSRTIHTFVGSGFLICDDWRAVDSWFCPCSFTFYAHQGEFERRQRHAVSVCVHTNAHEIVDFELHNERNVSVEDGS